MDHICVVQVDSNVEDKSNDLKQLREQIRKVDERLDCDLQVWFPFGLIVNVSAVRVALHSACGRLFCRTWPGRSRSGRQRWSRWKTIAKFWRRRLIMVMTRLCSS